MIYTLKKKKSLTFFFLYSFIRKCITKKTNKDFLNICKQPNLCLHHLFEAIKNLQFPFIKRNKINNNFKMEAQDILERRVLVATN